MKRKAFPASILMLKKASFLAMLWPTLISGCQTGSDEGNSNPGYTSQMLADGNTWVVKYGSDKPWNGCNYSPETHERCASLALVEIARIGKETCGLEPNQIFACERLVPGTYISCRLECKASPKTRKQNRWLQPKPGAPIVPAPSSGQGTQQTQNTSPSQLAPPLSQKQSIFQRAKRCSEKGGVWVNDSCQIEVED